MVTASVPRKTTDNMTNYDTGAVRDTGGKGRMDLLPMCALLRVSKHMEDALTHYPERNWEKGLPMHSMIDSAMRHLAKYMDGQTDEDHLCAAATNLLMAMWTEDKHPEMQDIPSRMGGSIGIEKPTDVFKTGDLTSMCSSYDAGPTPRCNETKDRDFCSCGGNPLDCDFYPEKRSGKQG